MLALSWPAAGPARAVDYHPLDVGNVWQYTSSVDGDQTMEIVGERTVLGVVTRVRRQTLATQTFENYWTRDAAGHLLLHGARNLTSPFEVAYFPPMRKVEAPLHLGRNWITEDVHLFSLDGTPWGDPPIDYYGEVLTEGEVTVPAGTFYAYGVGYEVYGRAESGLLTRDGRSYDLEGRRVDGGAGRPLDATDWYADGVGEPWMSWYEDEELGFKLVSFNLPTPARETSWGRVRWLYRTAPAAGEAGRRERTHD